MKTPIVIPARVVNAKPFNNPAPANNNGSIATETVRYAPEIMKNAAFNFSFQLMNLSCLLATGTGVDHLVVITDETLARRHERFINWKEKLKAAFFIISGAYLTVSVAMLPLLFAGAGLLKGFALTTLAGITMGVFIARPAFAKVLEILMKEGN